MKITKEILEAHLNCKTKGHLKLAGESGSKSDYEVMTTAARQASREEAIAKLVARFGQDGACRGQAMTISLLKQGLPLLADIDLEDANLSLRFDALKRVDGPSKLGNHHYLPVLHIPGDKIRRNEKVMLAVLSLVLDRVQGLRPVSGLIIRGSEARLTKAHLDGKLYRQAEQVLDQINGFQAGGEPPKLVLNNHCQMCEFRQRCRKQAVEEDNLSLLRGLNEKEVRKLARKGIFTLGQLAHIFRPRRKSKKAQPRTTKRQNALHAMAIRDRRVYVLGSPTVPHAPIQVYLDLEGKSDESFVYLIGLLVVHGGKEERFSFWADDRGQELATFEQFLAEVARLEKPFVLFCYGGYELTFLRRMRKQVEDKEAVDRVLGSTVNALSLVHSHLYFPCYSNGLKDIGGLLGCTWSEPEASGLQSLAWRARWEISGDEGWKRKLVAYNQEDCAALRKVVDFVSEVVARSDSEADNATPAGRPPVIRVQDLKIYPPERSWGHMPFTDPNFEHVNNCAYFDYQRQRVYVRSSKAIRRSQRQSRKSRNRKLRRNREFTLTASTCPSCKGTSVVNGVPKEEATCPVPRLKRAFDLILTSTGVRRSVVHCRSSVHKCLSCGSTFVPEQHTRLDKHFHGLKAWAMYQHVAHRLDLGAIQIMMEEFFGVRVFSGEMVMIKSLMARYYGPTQERLFRAILAGGLLHIDETEVTLDTGKGYVWVFANLEEVVYLYRPNREGDFLKEMLKDFRGVLVSDFYAAYDSIGCPQQKCLIHLIRDLNQELLANPFDEELQSVTKPFAILLRAVVATVDEHGLRRRHLQKHSREVAGYFEHLSGQAFRSDAAQALQTRLLKSKDKLFTFIDHDGVPWNNNNAENAIKRFAYYREVAPPPLHEEALKHYLVLLGLYQSCRYKGVNFLRFLMSGERDLDFFCRARRPQERLPVLQLYPEGFTPAHFASRTRERARRDASRTDEPVAGSGPGAGVAKADLV